MFGCGKAKKQLQDLESKVRELEREQNRTQYNERVDRLPLCSKFGLLEARSDFSRPEWPQTSPYKTEELLKKLTAPKSEDSTREVKDEG